MWDAKPGILPGTYHGEALHMQVIAAIKNHGDRKTTVTVPFLYTLLYKLPHELLHHTLNESPQLASSLYGDK